MQVLSVGGKRGMLEKVACHGSGNFVFREDKMKKVLCVVAVFIIAANVSFAQDETFDFDIVRGISSVWGYAGIPDFPGGPIMPSNTLDPYFDFNSSGYGARSKAMGGVYYAMDNDGYGSFLNPAGMRYTKKALMALDVSTYLDEHQQPYRMMQPFYSNPNTGWNFDYAQSSIDMEHNRLSEASAVAPFYYFDREWWFGGGFRTVYDLHSEVSTPLSYIEGDRAFYTQHRSIDAINMALATNFMPNIGVGVNMNIYIRGYEQNMWGPIYYLDEFDELAYDNGHLKEKSTFSGVNFDIGALADFEMVRVGLVLSTGHILEQNTTYLRGTVNPYGETEGAIDRFSIKNKFPMSYGGGLAFVPIENLEVGFDLTYKPLSKLRIDIDPQQLIWTEINDLNPNWEDLLQMRFGAEYIMDLGFGRLPLRAGMQNIPSVFKEIERFVNYNEGYLDSVNADSVWIADSTSYGDQYNTYLFSFGTGLKFDRIWFDVAYQFGSSKYNFTYVERADNYPPEDWFISDDVIKFDYSRLYFSVGMLF
jgi:hypothetical protein